MEIDDWDFVLEPIYNDQQFFGNLSKDDFGMHIVNFPIRVKKISENFILIASKYDFNSANIYVYDTRNGKMVKVIDNIHMDGFSPSLEKGFIVLSLSQNPYSTDMNELRTVFSKFSMDEDSEYILFPQTTYCNYDSRTDPKEKGCSTWDFIRFNVNTQNITKMDKAEYENISFTLDYFDKIENEYNTSIILREWKNSGIKDVVFASKGYKKILPIGDFLGKECRERFQSYKNSQKKNQPIILYQYGDQNVTFTAEDFGLTDPYHFKNIWKYHDD